MTQKYEKHGMTGHRAFRIWRGMKARCLYRRHPSWPNYGGRGISFCKEWDRFEYFWRDMGPTYRAGLTLERVDNDKDYSRDNCEWATQKTQCRNTRRNRRIETPWGHLTVTEAAERAGINSKRLFKRIYLGWPAERLFIEPTSNNVTGKNGVPSLMRLVSVYRVPEAPVILYDLLKARRSDVSISHHKMPTMRQHRAFIRSYPYAVWYLIQIGHDYIGSIYLTKANEIGIFVFAKHWGRGHGAKAILMLMQKHPREQFLANVSPANAKSIRLFRRLGFTYLQNTYEYRA